jgi:hypothetical protein
MKLKNLLIVGLLVVLFSGCTEVKQQFGNMFRIIGALAKEYNHRNIHVEMNNKEMTVTFINSPFGEFEEPQRQAKAREIARFCVGLLKEDSTIGNITIAFTIHEKRFLIVDYTSTQGVYTFKVSEL